MARKFSSGKEAMSWLLRGEEPATGKGAQLEREIAESLAFPGPGRGKSEAQLQLEIDAYKEKQEAKRDRLESAARRAKGEATAAFGTANRIAGGIPMGQPILVGHHSERRHRRDIARMDRSMRKGIEAEERAADLTRAAERIGKGGISSDDPEAVRKLKAELVGLQDAQQKMKAANAAIRKHARAGADAQIAALVALGFKEGQARDLLKPDFAGRIGFADYALTNNNANVRRIEKRIAELTKRQEAPTQAPITGTIEGLSFTLSENRPINRTQIEFSGKPGDVLRGKLKRAGFRWAPSEGAWQRHLSSGAWYQAKQLLGV